MLLPGSTAVRRLSRGGWFSMPCKRIGLDCRGGTWSAVSTRGAAESSVTTSAWATGPPDDDGALGQAAVGEVRIREDLRDRLLGDRRFLDALLDLLVAGRVELLVLRRLERRLQAGGLRLELGELRPERRELG